MQPDSTTSSLFGDPRLPARFWAKVEVQANGCWLWTASLTATGYGRFGVGRRSERAHRVSYQALVAEIPEGSELDHLCRNRACVNPVHVEPVTHRINLLRGDGVPGRNARVTHCPNGHAYDEANTRWERDGHRRCRACERRHHRRYYLANKKRILAAHRDWVKRNRDHARAYGTEWMRRKRRSISSVRGISL